MNVCMMKKALFKDSVKEIKNTFKRFLSILLMAFLGVGFFAGIRATSPDMVDTIDKYYDAQNVYDIQILSTLGLTEEDVDEIAKIDDVEKVQESYETDGKVKVGEKEVIVKAIALDELNQPLLLSGEWPQKENECLVEESFLTTNQKQIGDTIDLEIENTTNDDGEEIAYLKQTKVKIVGTVQSPLYISRDRGTSSLGAGKIDYYIYLAKENINAKDVYTSIYIKVKEAEKEITSSEEYEAKIEKVENQIEEIKEEREQARRNQLVESANEKVQEAEEELNTQKNEAETKIEEAEQELADGKEEIRKAESEVKENREKADSEFSKAEQELADAKKQISDSEQELITKEQETNQQFQELEVKKNELKTNLNQVNGALEELQQKYEAVLIIINYEAVSEEQRQINELQKAELEKQIQNLQQNKQVLEASITQIETGIQTGKQELASGKSQIETGKQELAQKETEFQETKKSTEQKLEEAEKEIADAKQELQDGEEELNQQKAEFDEKIEDAESKLLDAKEEILEIENPTWYILDRNSNAGYVGFIQDSESIENIGKVFPVVFFIVATLISLTSMTRMVEEQRMQIGTLKALGYRSWQIMGKYVLYASLACLIGGILGMSVGFVCLPKIIWMMYEMMYQMTDISLSFNVKYGGIGLILISVCILGATIYTVLKELRDTPANLMRPKAPKSGNRVFLEKIPVIWKHLNFSQKVTVRNLFRYKKRFYMTVIGILGCTALILTGFGIKDSVMQIIPNQFEKVFSYDMQATLKDSASAVQKEECGQELLQKEEIEKIAMVYMTSETAVKGEASEDVQVIVPEEEEKLDGIVSIRDVDTQEKVKLKTDEICLTDKAAQLLEVKAGDTIILRDSDEKEVEIKISNIIENYVQHYVIMSRETFENLYHEKYKTNVIFMKNVELSEEEQDELASQIMTKSEISSVTNVNKTAESIEDTMSSLNYVVIVLIVSAGLLAFVVLYNLSNVNISERIRELATIKVLGFYDKEVYRYVTRETIILTAIGIVLGLGAGYFLSFYILGTCEINVLRFSKAIRPISYVYAALITIVFTIIVNIATYFALKKIDMIESLKSVE